MTTRYAVADISGTLQIGATRGLAAGRAGLGVAGGVLWVDPLDPARVCVTLDDPGAARETLVALFGVRAGSLSAGAGLAELGLAEVGPGWALADATRLALIRWLGERSPDQLDGFLLGLEEAVLQRRLSAFTDPLPAPQTLRERALQAAAQAAQRNAPALPGLADLIREFLAGLAEAGDAAAGDALAAMSADTAPQRVASPTWRLGSLLTPLPAGMVLAEGADSAASAAPTWRHCATDWDLVPRGLFDPAEDAVAWRLDRRTGGRPTVTIRCAGAAGAPAEGAGYVARLLALGEPLPLALVELQFQQGTWTGTAELLHLPDGTDLDECWVDVTSAGNPRPFRRGSARTAARARRWAVRGVTRLRFGVAAGALLDQSQPLTEGIAGLERARMDYSDLAIRSRARPHQLAHLELGQLLLAASLRGGRDHEADDIAEEIAIEAAALGQDPAAAVAGAPDLGHPGWRLSVAELGLLVPADPR